jgi:UDP:flavonoid glycosyltransferase YjiC (YdhE family)
MPANLRAVFVNHAGNGSVNRAATAGVPTLLMPTGRDQFQVARGATAAGMAITLAPEERHQTHIRAALHQ